MLYSVFLVLHIIGACVTGLVASYTGLVLWRKDSAHYRRLAQALGILAGLETITGVTLSVLSLNISTLSLCGNLAVYLSVIFALEAILFVRMKKVSLLFPLQLAFTPTAAGLAYFALAAARGF